MSAFIEVLSLLAVAGLAMVWLASRPSIALLAPPAGAERVVAATSLPSISLDGQLDRLAAAVPIQVKSPVESAVYVAVPEIDISVLGLGGDRADADRQIWRRAQKSLDRTSKGS